MKRFKRPIGFICTKPLAFTFYLCLLLGFTGGIILTASSNWEELLSKFSITILISPFFVAPPVFTIYNIAYLASPHQSPETKKAGQVIEFATICLGALCSMLFPTDIQWDMNWQEQLYNEELHTPIATWGLPTVITIAAVAALGYLLLRLLQLYRLPPLPAVFCISAMYLGAALCIAWMIQICKHAPIHCIYPFNLLLIFAKVLKETVMDWKDLQKEPPIGKSRPVRFLHRITANALCIPWLALLFALPLFGILVAILTLFGQTPDSVIRAWTETSGWTFSQKISPQNIYQDQHYLCTVAAGGHRKIVKPLREGKRHGHKVLVNRQLCIANAFEQLLEEKLPRTHRVIRRAYDKYGYPVAKHIKSPYIADIIWFLMKPLEWFFLAMLYLFDLKPENRIAVQYPHAPLPTLCENKKGTPSPSPCQRG